MKAILNRSFTFSIIKTITIFGLLLFFIACKKEVKEAVKPKEDVAVNNFKKTIWEVKAIHPDGIFLDVKAIDGYGNTYDVISIQYADQTSLMDIKAFVKGKILPVKLLVNDGKLTPVKAIANDGTLYNIKAIATNGDRLNIKGVERAGNIIHLNAIAKNGNYYGIKAISPTGALNDVKGVKTVKTDLEYTLNGAKIYAHIKAVAQTGCVGDNFLWHIVAIHPDGYTLEMKAFDKSGNAFDIKAIRDADQRSLLDIKAFVEENKQLPVKLILSDDKYAPLNAIAEDGTLYEIKAIIPNGDKLDVKGVSRSGNIIHIKAINKEGKFYGVKALSPEGELNDVKGIKMFKVPLELKVNDVEVYAHVKALSQGR